MSDIEKTILKTLHELDSPGGTITCADAARCLRQAINATRLEILGSLPVSVQAEYIAFQAAELAQGELIVLCQPGAPPLPHPQDFVDYWSNRARIAKNCRLRERYAATALQISATRRLKVNRREVGTIQIQAALETVAKCEPNAGPEAMPPLKRALRLALSLGAHEMAAQVAEAMVALAEKCWSNKVKEVNLWPQCFDAVLVEQAGKLDIPKTFRDKLVRETEATLQLSLNGVSESTGMAYMNLAHEAKRLVDFYRREERPEDVDRFVKSLQKAVLKGCEKLIPMHVAMCVQPTVQFLHDNGSSKLANELSAKMLSCSKSLPGTLPEWRFPMTVTAEQVQPTLARICALETDDAIRQLAFGLIPQPLERHDSSTVISAVVGVQTIGDEGRTTSSSKPPEESAESLAISAYCSGVDAMGAIVQCLFDETISRKGITAEALAGFCVGSRAFGMDRREVLRRGFAAWLQRDCASAILFFLPQIERAVQNIVQGAGSSGLQPPKGGAAMDYKLLDGLLADPAAETALGSESTRYLRLLLTDRRGWNIRNAVLHGWVDPCSLSRPVCDRVVHAVLLLAAKTADIDGTATC